MLKLKNKLITEIVEGTEKGDIDWALVSNLRVFKARFKGLTLAFNSLKEPKFEIDTLNLCASKESGEMDIVNAGIGDAIRATLEKLSEAINRQIK